MKNMVVTLCQQNSIVGDIAGNEAAVRHTHAQAGQSDLLIFPELFLSGYPPEDLVRNPDFQTRIMASLQKLATITQTGASIILGSPFVEKNHVYNAAILLQGGKIAGTSFKKHLPNYGVFDEKRVFTPGQPHLFEISNIKFGAMVCEDSWHDDVAMDLAGQGAEILLSINASPFEKHKHPIREAHMNDRITQTGLPMIYVNQMGGQDEIVFDGRSFVQNADHDHVVTAPAWEEINIETQWQKSGDKWMCVTHTKAPALSEFENIYTALQTGLRHYVQKNGFKNVVLGLSGGMDSAFVAALAADALGADHVQAVLMPSPYTSKESFEDADFVAKALGIKIDVIAIEKPMQVMQETLSPYFIGKPADITEENIQSRLRAVILMGLANKHHYLLLTTGNKSELAMGYATLYGDMAGAYNPIKDVYKTDLYKLAHWRNTKGVVFNDNILNKAPTAELRPNQKDADSLPPYPELDNILEGLVEKNQSCAEIIKSGHDRETVSKVWNMLKRAEYKRYQSPPGVKISNRAFGRDWRFPLTNKFVIEEEK